MSEEQNRAIEVLEQLIKSIKNLRPEESKGAEQALESMGFPSIEILEIRVGFMKSAQSSGMNVYDWLRKECRLILSDRAYMRSVPNQCKVDLSNYHARLYGGQWCDPDDDIMFDGLRKKYKEYISKKTGPYTA